MPRLTEHSGVGRIDHPYYNRVRFRLLCFHSETPGARVNTAGKQRPRWSAIARNSHIDLVESLAGNLARPDNGAIFQMRSNLQGRHETWQKRPGESTCIQYRSWIL